MPRSVALKRTSKWTNVGVSAVANTNGRARAYFNFVRDKWPCNQHGNYARIVSIYALAHACMSEHCRWNGARGTQLRAEGDQINARPSFVVPAKFPPDERMIKRGHYYSNNQSRLSPFAITACWSNYPRFASREMSLNEREGSSEFSQPVRTFTIISRLFCIVRDNVLSQTKFRSHSF